MKTYRYYFAALLAIFSSTVFSQPVRDTNALQVEIMIFSGRPNPVFTVTNPAEIREIMSLVNGLPRPSSYATGSAASPSGLGYQGIVVRNRSNVGSELESFVVNRANVQFTRSQALGSKGKATDNVLAAPEARVDSSAALERRLVALAQSKGVIDEALVAHINSGK